MFFSTADFTIDKSAVLSDAYKITELKIILKRCNNLVE